MKRETHNLLPIKNKLIYNKSGISTNKPNCRRLKLHNMILSLLFIFLINIPAQEVFAGNNPTKYDFDEISINNFDITLFELIKNEFEIKVGETDKPIAALLRECREHLLPGGNGPFTWDQTCLDMVQLLAMYECMKENERACTELKSEDLIVEI